MVVTVFLYGQVNIIVTATSGVPVYPGLDWNCWPSWTVGCLFMPEAYGIFWLFYKLSEWKLGKLGLKV